MPYGLSSTCFLLSGRQSRATDRRSPHALGIDATVPTHTEEARYKATTESGCPERDCASGTFPRQPAADLPDKGAHDGTPPAGATPGHPSASTNTDLAPATVGPHPARRGEPKRHASAATAKHDGAHRPPRRGNAHRYTGTKRHPRLRPGCVEHYVHAREPRKCLHPIRDRGHGASVAKPVDGSVSQRMGDKRHASQPARRGRKRWPGSGIKSRLGKLRGTTATPGRRRPPRAPPARDRTFKLRRARLSSHEPRNPGRRPATEGARIPATEASRGPVMWRGRRDGICPITGIARVTRQPALAGEDLWSYLCNMSKLGSFPNFSM